MLKSPLRKSTDHWSLLKHRNYDFAHFLRGGGGGRGHNMIPKDHELLSQTQMAAIFLYIVLKSLINFLLMRMRILKDRA